MSRTAHQAIHTKCTMDQPIQLLIDKLSTKSSDLYIFWQNYDQLYRQYNEKVQENQIMKKEMEELRRDINLRVGQSQKVQGRDKESQYLKQRLRNIQNSNDQLKAQIDRLKNNNRDLKIDNSRFIEETNHMQGLITQLREQNSLQRNSIANILEKLKLAQNQINGYSKIYEQVEEKTIVINNLVAKQKQINSLLQEKDEEIQELARLCRQTKTKYQKILKDSLQNAKESVMASLPAHHKTIYK